MVQVFFIVVCISVELVLCSLLPPHPSSPLHRVSELILRAEPSPRLHSRFLTGCKSERGNMSTSSVSVHEGRAGHCVSPRLLTRRSPQRGSLPPFLPPCLLPSFWGAHEADCVWGPSWDERGEACVRQADVVHWCGSGSSFSQGRLALCCTVLLCGSREDSETMTHDLQVPERPTGCSLISSAAGGWKWWESQKCCNAISPGCSPVLTHSRHSDRKRSAAVFFFPT